MDCGERDENGMPVEKLQNSLYSGSSNFSISVMETELQNWVTNGIQGGQRGQEIKDSSQVLICTSQ